MGIDLYKMMCYYIWVADSVVAIPSNRDVAQFGSASGLGPEGRRFESCHPDQTFLRHGSIAQLGERLPYKQDVTGSSPVTPTKHAGVAQLVEQLICNQQVAGSSPITSSKQGKLIACPYIWESSRVAKGGRL